MHQPIGRLLTSVVVALALLAAAPAGGAMDDPRAPVEQLHAGLEQVMRQAEELGFKGRFELLDPILAEAYDLEWMAAKTLGRHWKKLSMEERARWAALFRQLTVATYADRFDGFDGERFETLSVEPSAQGTTLVHTRVVPADDDPVSLDYRVRLRADRFRIIDVYLDGTLSELALRRSDYSALVKREGFDALVSAVQAKIVEAENGTD